MVLLTSETFPNKASVISFLFDKKDECPNFLADAIDRWLHTEDVIQAKKDRCRLIFD